MKFLVVLLVAVSVCHATPVAEPIYADYKTPQAAPVVLPQPAVTVTRVLPLSPSPVRVFAQPQPLPLPLARAPFHVPTPLVASPIPVQAPIPVAAPFSPVANILPQPVAAPVAVPVPAPVTSSQFHAQDEFGGFSFGYANGQSTKQEARSPDGVTRGAYSYVDANGITQHVEYISDPVNGFRVAGTNIPVVPDAQTVNVAAPVMDTPEVKAAKAEFAKAFNAEVARNAALEAEEEEMAENEVVASRKKRSPTYSNSYGAPAAPVQTVVQNVVPTQVVSIPESQFVEPPQQFRAVLVPNHRFLTPVPAPHFSAGVIAAPAATPLIAHAPVPAPLIAHPAPVATPLIAHPAPIVSPVPTPLATIASPVPVAAPNTQFHAQDEFGGFSFGYQNANSARQESRSADGVTRGSYSYIDANGITQHVQYTADAINGFQVIGTNLPVAPEA